MVGSHGTDRPEATQTRSGGLTSWEQRSSRGVEAGRGGGWVDVAHGLPRELHTAGRICDILYTPNDQNLKGVTNIRANISLWQGLLGVRPPDGTRDPYRRQPRRLHHLRQGLLAVEQPDDTQTHPHRRQSLRMQNLQQVILGERPPDDASAKSFWRPPLRLHHLRPSLLTVRQLDGTRAQPYRQPPLHLYRLR